MNNFLEDSKSLAKYWNSHSLELETGTETGTETGGCIFHHEIPLNKFLINFNDLQLFYFLLGLSARFQFYQSLKACKPRN